MGLPDPDSARTWGGKLLVDRSGTTIGTCTEIFVDDATGLPEWARMDLSGGPVFIPLMDATESGDHVRVAVRQADVADAPPAGPAGHMSPDDEERLYRHYGIQFSREVSESLLPVDEAVVSLEQNLPRAVDADRGRLLPALAAGTVGALAAVAAAVFWRRQLQHQLPPTQPLTARARAASERAAVQARVAAERATVQARAAAKQAAAVVAAAGTLRLQRIPVDVEPQPVELPSRRAKAIAALEAVAGFTAGYALRARLEGSRLEQFTQAPSWAQRPQLQENVGRVQARLTRTLQSANAQVSRGAGALTGRAGGRSGSSSDVPSGSENSGTPA